jgi:hypothetical protein
MQLYHHSGDFFSVKFLILYSTHVKWFCAIECVRILHVDFATAFDYLVSRRGLLSLENYCDVISGD